MAVVNASRDYNNVRQGNAIGQNLSRDTQEFDLVVSSLFAANEAALILCYNKGCKNLFDENVSAEAYVDALGDIAVWQLRPNEKLAVETISYSSYSIARYAWLGRRDSNTISHFLGLRTASERRGDVCRISCAAGALLKFIQETQGAQEVAIRRTSPVEASDYGSYSPPLT